jgi:Cu-Zn family superoxide dismutase
MVRILNNPLQARRLALSTLVAVAAVACVAQPAEGHDSPLANVASLVAVVVPTEGNTCNGTVRFIEFGDGVKIVADVRGLTPGARHGFHIHEFGDATAEDGTSAGGHYNPQGHDHALPHQGERHAGDLGNLEADSTGRATWELVTNEITLAGDWNPVIGRGVIVHAKPDDGGQPTGNAGARIGIGVIGIARQ